MTSMLFGERELLMNEVVEALKARRIVSAVLFLSRHRRIDWMRFERQARTRKVAWVSDQQVLAPKSRKQNDIIKLK